ncbi:MAG: hypothetical protein E7632_12515 [Ruminococcaceae bacterium]|nr:hypothetical protein [Oscillospiraceae bacterium]
MQKVDAVVRRETLYIAVWVIILSVLMEAVFLILGAWNVNVLFGNLLGGAAAVLNFFLMGLTVQKALTKTEKEAKDLVRLSQTLRMLMLFVVAMIACLVPVFNLVAALVPLLFPRIAIMFRTLFGVREQAPSEGGEVK